MNLVPEVKNKVITLAEKEPLKIEVRLPSRRNNSVTYVSLNSIGVKPTDKILVVVYDDALVVFKEV